MSSEYVAMTVNERLYVSGLLDEFDQAVEQKDVDRVIKILKQVEIGEASILPILQQLKLK